MSVCGGGPVSRAPPADLGSVTRLKLIPSRRERKPSFAGRCSRAPNPQGEARLAHESLRGAWNPDSLPRRRRAVREGGLRVVPAANSFAPGCFAPDSGPSPGPPLPNHPLRIITPGPSAPDPSTRGRFAPGLRTFHSGTIRSSTIRFGYAPIPFRVTNLRGSFGPILSYLGTDVRTPKRRNRLEGAGSTGHFDVGVMGVRGDGAPQVRRRRGGDVPAGARRGGGAGRMKVKQDQRLPTNYYNSVDNCVTFASAGTTEGDALQRGAGSRARASRP
jgi:hypothetical protein